MGVGVTIAMILASTPVMASEYLNVDLDFISYERIQLCSDCGWISLDQHGDSHEDAYDMAVLEILVENHNVDYEDHMKLTRSYGIASVSGLEVYVYDGDGHKRVPVTGIREPSEPDSFNNVARADCDAWYPDDQRSLSSCYGRADKYELEVIEYERQLAIYNKVQELEAYEQCADSKLKGSIPDGESKELTLCFLIPRDIADPYNLVMWYDGGDYWQYVFFDRECKDSSWPERCGGSWDLGRVIVDDGIYEYTIADTSIYELEVPGFTAMLEETARNALKMWSDVNPGIEFVLVDDKEGADFNILMGGTGETKTLFGGISDKWGEVNDIGCLVEHDIDCTMTIYVENRVGGDVVLFSQVLLGYTILHETGHLLGLPHHPSALHAMHSPLDTNVSWYDPDEYNFVAPAFRYPEIEVAMCMP